MRSPGCSSICACISCALPSSPGLPSLMLSMCLQTKDGKRAKSVTIDEFFDCFKETIRSARAKWLIHRPGVPFRKCTFVYDNPNFHKLSEEQKKDLVKPGELLDSIKQVVEASPYSGDIMQPIETTHGTICEEWAKQRFAGGCSDEVDEMEQELRDIFERMITAKSVQANIRKLVKCLYHIAHVSKGGYATPELI